MGIQEAAGNMARAASSFENAGSLSSGAGEKLTEGISRIVKLQTKVAELKREVTAIGQFWENEVNPKLASAASEFSDASGYIEQCIGEELVGSLAEIPVAVDEVPAILLKVQADKGKDTAEDIIQMNDAPERAANFVAMLDGISGNIQTELMAIALDQKVQTVQLSETATLLATEATQAADGLRGL